MNVPFFRTTPWCLAAVLGGLLLACAGPNGSSEEASPSGDSSGRAPQSEFKLEGTVQYRQVEGGAWVIEGKDGTTYEPRGLPEEFREEGLPVRVWANRLEDQASIRMVGPIISIERIERR